MCENCSYDGSVHVSAKSMCTSTTRFHPPIWKSKTHLFNSPHSLLDYLLKTKSHIQLLSRGCLPFLHKSLKRYINSAAFCPALTPTLTCWEVVHCSGRVLSPLDLLLFSSAKPIRLLYLNLPLKLDRTLRHTLALYLFRAT